MTLPLNEESEKLLNQAADISRSLCHYYLGTEHVFIALMQSRDADIEAVLKEFSLTPEELVQKVKSTLKTGHNPQPRGISVTPRQRKVSSLSQEIARKYHFSYVEPLHLFLAIIHEGEGIPVRKLRELGADIESMRMELILHLRKKAIDNKADVLSKNTPFLNKVGRDLTALARMGQLTPVIGRKDEIRKVAQILARKTKNNPIILGEAGVGKTAIVEGLAQIIISPHSPPDLKEKRIVEINFGTLLSGTKYRGEFEQKIQEMVEETKKNPNAVLFVDEFHTIAGTGKTEEGTLDAANILKPALTRGEIRVIGATTIDDYRRIIEKDPALERRFQTIILEEPTKNETMEILEGVRESYETHHRVEISHEAMRAAVDLSVRYIWDRRLPDKAIDLIDQAAAQKQLHTLVLKPQDYKEMVRQPRPIKTIHSDDIAQVISDWTGIPSSKITEEEGRKLLRLEESIHQRVIGQEEAIETVARVVRNAKVGLDNPCRPNGVFLFMGPSGVGKTELAKALAEFLFEDEQRLLRFDMSEYQESHTVSRLLGAPPGYIGYDSEGQLTGKVRTNPYSVILFDEIEKAHQSIYDVFLQIFDEGMLTDSHGRTVNFCNTIVIMTSNLGADVFGEKGEVGFTPVGSDSERRKKIIDRLKQTVKDKFRPELLNRIDEIVVFKHLTEIEIRKIIDKFISYINERLENRNLKIELDESAYRELIRVGYSREYGAREMERAINRMLSAPLAEAILQGGFMKDEVIRVSGGPEGFTFGHVSLEKV